MAFSTFLHQNLWAEKLGEDLPNTGFSLNQATVSLLMKLKRGQFLVFNQNTRNREAADLWRQLCNQRVSIYAHVPWQSHT